MAMSNSALAVGNGSRILMTAPSVPEAEQRKGQEEGQRGVDVVAAAGDVMAHLVGAENAEDRAP